MNELRDLLEAHKLLMGYPNLTNLRAAVEKQLTDLDAKLAAPKPVVATPVSVEVPDPAPEVPVVDRRVE